MPDPVAPRNSVIDPAAPGRGDAPCRLVLIRFPQPAAAGRPCYVGWQKPDGQAPASSLAVRQGLRPRRPASMGQVRHQLLDPQGRDHARSSGVAAIFADQPIAAIEMHYIGGAAQEPAEIDSLMLVARSNAGGKVAEFPKDPVFGDQPVFVKVESQILIGIPGGDAEMDHTTSVSTLPVASIPIVAGAASVYTPFSLMKPEGQVLLLSAPLDLVHPGYGRLRFLYWKEKSSIFFGEGANELSVTLLQNTTFTAVYACRRESSCR